MPSRTALAVAAALALRCAVAQVGYGPGAQGNANLQNLLAALTQGAEVVMYTPLANGLLQVTRFQPPLALPHPEAEAAVAIARQHLRMLDIQNPTPDQLARALAGGAIESRDGPQQLPGVLPLTGKPPLITTQVVLANGLPQVAPALGSAAAGGSVPTLPEERNLR